MTNCTLIGMQDRRGCTSMREGRGQRRVRLSPTGTGEEIGFPFDVVCDSIEGNDEKEKVRYLS